MVSEPTRSPLVWRFMVGYFDRFLRRHMNALRLARWGVPRFADHPGPIVVYCNHPAWWDAAVVILLAGRLFPKRTSHAPFDAQMLERYAIFSRIGAFAVDLDSARGAAQFLKASRNILARPEAMIWITAQGRFADVRARPLDLRGGVARLPELAPDTLFVPLALDYAFWEERGAEACAAFGAPVRGADLLALPRPERLARMEAALTDTLDRLAADVIARDPARFTALVSGAKGVGGIYDLGRRLRAALTGRRFDPAHRAGLDQATEEDRLP
ncbi:1-acyl-sn-glycerol-3-phosphate acyltransferase [Methylobacterium gossipiicola]|uniref:1-acyl-sn-glycerol-3-phosphate acyltransferase n=2 Tax=Methylobacterium gossipiicola TaxID=582675 RepID=A0A1I2TW73_9HYPH|nr:1-acyl-sn-glycerol-3-phosphate acyltransferase [Methylobacterium gossipiicola]